MTLPYLHKRAKEQAQECGAKISEKYFKADDKALEEFMKYQNPMFQVLYNQKKYLDGRWCMMNRVLLDPTPPANEVKSPIILSVSAVQSDKTVSTGFHPISYESLKNLAENMHLFAHSPSIYSPIMRFDHYSNNFKWDYRRRLHNISFVGNMLAYDFDNGELTFKGAEDIAKKILEDTSFPSLIIRSKSDPKYDYDRFKMMIQTNFIYPKYPKDKVPKGYEHVDIEKYKDLYKLVATKYGFFEMMDKSTNDLSRLIARVTNKNDERREYVIVR